MRRHRDGRLEHRGVVVRDVAHHRGFQALGLLERHEAWAAADEGIPAQAALLDRLQQERRLPVAAQPDVGPEGGDQVSGDDGGSVHATKTTLRRKVERAGRKGLSVRPCGRPARGAGTRPRCGTTTASTRSVPRPELDFERGPFRDRLGRSHAVRQAGRFPRRSPGDRARRDRDPRRARPRRGRGRRGRVRDHRPGAARRGRPGSRAAGGGRRRPADLAAGGHDQQGLRVEHPGGRDRRPDDPLRRPQRDRRGRDGVDVERAVRAAEGAVRLPARRRRAGRPDGPRRADVDLRRPAHGRAGVVRLARARDHARGTGRVGAPLARARGRGAGRGALRRRDRARRRGHGGRGPAPRHDAREAGVAEAGLRR